MTACTNNGGSRARRAVTAALVGVLSVGAAPMVALATGAAPASGDVSLLATENAAFNGATIYYANGEDGASFVYDEDNSFQGLEPESFVYANTAEKIEKVFTYAKTPGSASEGYHYYYVKIDQSSTGVGATFDNGSGENIVYTAEGKEVTLRGSKVASGDDMQPGTYAVVSYFGNGAGGYICATHADTFTIVNGGLEGAELIENGDANDTTFAYTGEIGSASVDTIRGKMGVAVDGVVLPTSAYDITSIVEKDKNDELLGKGTNLKPGTTYVVTVVGRGEGYAGVNAKLEFTFGQLNLDDAVIVSKGASTTVPTTGDLGSFVTEFNGADPDDVYMPRLDVKVSGPEDGVYTFTITSSAEDDKDGDYVTGTATVQVAVGDDNATFSYGGSSIPTTGQWGGSNSSTGSYMYTYEKTDPNDKPFDVTKLGATTDSGEDVAITYTVQNAKTGVEGTVDNLDDLGEWIVTAVANESVDAQRWVGAATIRVINKNALTDAANVFVSYDGKLVPSGQHIKDTYTGENLLDKLAITVKAGDKTLVEGEDYTVEVSTKDQTGKTVVVDEVVDHGTYTVTIKGESFTLGNDTNKTVSYTFDVAKRTLKTISPSNAFATEDTYFGTSPVVQGTKYYYAHTGEEIAPEFTFTGDDGETYTVPADQFEVTYKKNVNGAFQSAKLKDEGIYVIDSITLKADNFTGTVAAASTSDRIEVTKTGSFVDVPNDAWYAEEVAIAKQQGYVGGVGGTNFFAPMNNITRADFVCVLYRMAGGSIGTVQEGMTNEEISYISQFEDVDQNAYYAKAVAWATKMGVVNGYGDTFGTERAISTEEFVTMLARYAAKMGTDTSADTDAVLGAVADGDEVSSYARDAVAWAVSEGYIAKDGNLIDPQGTIYRARAIKIAVDYQPEQLDTILDQGNNAEDK